MAKPEEPADLDVMESLEKKSMVDDKDGVIDTLRRELEEELVVTNSLTHLVAEKTAELEHLQKKVTEQETRIYNLEDQIEEWTNQADSCDKLLEQKDCEIEMLKKTLKIEKQQRRDLEDMTMEVGKINILEKESLEKKVTSLQAEIEKLKEERKHEVEEETAEIDLPTREDKSERSSDGPSIIDLEKIEDGESFRNARIKECKESDMKKEEFNPDIEVLMNDLFMLIKQNEEQKEEIERLKAEQTSISENNRNIVMELETSIVEKAAEIQHQKHEIKRLSSAIETGESDLDQYSHIKQVREELEFRISELETTNSQLQMRLSEHEATKDAVTKQYDKMKKKLELEREQNAELNRQILEVSNLYDTYYMKCEEFEKGRIKGIQTAFNNQQFQDPAKAVASGSDRQKGSERDQSQTKATERSFDGSAEANTETKATVSSMDKRESEAQTSCRNESRNQSKCKVDSLLLVAARVARFLMFVGFTFFFAIILRVHYGLSWGQISAVMFATYMLLLNLWTIVAGGKRISSDNFTPDTRKLRMAVQDLILRLDETNFKQFREIYEGYIVESFTEEQTNRSHSLEDEVRFLTSRNDVLAKELEKLKNVNAALHTNYNQIKREIDLMGIKRIEEDELKQKIIQCLKDENKEMELQLSAKMKSEINSDESSGLKEASLIKLLLFAILEGLLLMSASSSFILIPASILSIVFLALIYRTDVQLGFASKEILGYQRTVKDLLHKVNTYREEGKQTSDEVRDLEALVDREHDIIAKQRHAIERLEMQLQRAINKYREKKKIMGKFIWLQEQGLGDFVGLNTPKTFEQMMVKPQVNKSQDPIDKSDQSAINQDDKLKWKLFSLKTVLAIALISAGVNTFKMDYSPNLLYVNIDPFYLAGIIAGLFLVLALVKGRLRKRHILQNADVITQLRESQEDQLIMREQVEMLRNLLSIEREFVAKVEKEAEIAKDPQKNASKEEVNAVIDRLIEVSKKRDELEVTANSALNKYDNIKKTLEDILSREKYLSEEVSVLRTQRRELQSDLMKEQLKHIDMFEEMRRLKENTEKDLDNSQNCDVEWDFTIEEYIDKTIMQDAATSPESALVLESDQILENLELVGNQAQKNRKNRRKGKYKQKCEHIENSHHEGKADVKDHPLPHEEAEVDVIENDAWKQVGTQKVEHSAGEDKEGQPEVVKQMEKNGGKRETDKVQKEKDTSEIKGDSKNSDVEINKEDLAYAHVIKNEGTQEFTKPLKDENGESESSLLRKIERQKLLLKAKDSELEQLKELLDLTNLNISRENSDSGTERDCKKMLSYDVANLRDLEKEMRRLATEIFRLKDLCTDSRRELKDMERFEKLTDGFVIYLLEYVVLFRYRITAEKAADIAKVNAMEEEIEAAERQIEKLQADVEKEKQARNHVISEYEGEYERLETRLSKAYEDIRKRLMEERSLRSEIMKQYENEIEDIQDKTTAILKDLKIQLKQERKGKEETKIQNEEMGKKIKELESELRSIDESGRLKHQMDVDLQDFMIEVNEGKRGKIQQPRAIAFKELAEEEANRRVKDLNKGLEEAERNIDNYKNALNEKEETIGWLEKQENILTRKIDMQGERMKDLEREVRNHATGEEDTLEVCGELSKDSKDGLIFNLATRNGSQKWDCPSSMSVIQVTRSSEGFGIASDIIDGKLLPCSTEDLEDSWFQLDLGQGIKIIPKAYSLCHGWVSKDGSLRNWVLEGSLNGERWEILRNHTADTSINGRFMAAKWDLPESHLPCRHLRIRMTGPNSSNTNELFISAIEIFGKITHSA